MLRRSSLAKTSRRSCLSAPYFRPVPWSKRDKFCTQAELEAYRKEIEEAAQAAQDNVSTAEAYTGELRALANTAHSRGSTIAKWSDQIDEALKAFLPVLAGLDKESDELSAEEAALAKLKPIDCTEKPKVPPPPQGPPPPPPNAGGGVLKAPSFTPTPWSSKKAFCTQAEIDAYRKEIEAVLATANKNLAAANDYMKSLEARAQGADAKTKVKDKADQAVKDYQPNVDALKADQKELPDEVNRLKTVKPTACPEKTSTGFPPEHASSGGSACGAAVLAQVNALRTDPAGYADMLAQYRTYYHGNLVSEPGHPVTAGHP